MPTTKYALEALLSSSQASVLIGKNDFDAIALAHENLLAFVFAEEKFDLIVQGYTEFENELLNQTFQQLLNNAKNYNWQQEKRGQINRKLINLLSATRGYGDHIRHAVHSLLGRDSPEAATCVEQFSKCYDASMSYRVLEALRNYSQHSGFPIHAMSFSIAKRDQPRRNRVAATMAVYTKTQYLRKDAQFKKSVLEELESLGGRVDVKPMVRDYVAAFSEVHDFLRKAVRTRANEWEQTIHAAVNSFASAAPADKMSGLAAVRKLDDAIIEKVPIFTEIIEYRSYLEKKNSDLSNLGSVYVSAETIDPTE